MRSQNVNWVFASLFALAGLAGCSSDASSAGAGGSNAAGGAAPSAGAGGVHSGGASGSTTGGSNTAGGSAGANTAGDSTTGGSNTAGGSAGTASLECTPFTACGGDLTGPWSVSRDCLSADSQKQISDGIKFCPDATVQIVSLTDQGTITFIQGSLKRDEMVTVHFSETVPSSCLSAGMDCTAISPQCVPLDANGCSCDMIVPTPLRLEYSYTKTDTGFTTTDPTDGSTETFDYCVAGNVLRLRSGEDITVAQRASQ